MIKQIINFWNENFNKGVSVFQICLMVSMIFAGIVGNQFLVLFSMTACILGYFEPTNNRFSFDKQRRRSRK